MSDLYTELLVKKQKTAKDSLIKIGLITLTVLAVIAGLIIHPYALVLAVGLFVADYFIIPKTDLEYEYLFVNGDMDVDVIMSRQKRKKAISFRIQDADIVAPVKSHRMDYYNNNTKMKVMDYSSGNPEHKIFAVVTRVKNEPARILIEPDEKLAQQMKNSAPGKVFLD